MAAQEPTSGDASLVTLTFLFTDIEGSTALWEQEPERMRSALQRHNSLLSAAVEHHHGWVFKTVGDAFCVTFDRAADAIGAAYQIQSSLDAETWPTRTPLRVRVALHTGPAHLSAGDYFGTTVNRCARLLAVARGGQTLLSSTTESLAASALPAGVSLRDLGLHRLRDLPHPIHVFQLVHPGLDPVLLEIDELPGGSKLTAQPLARFNPIELFDVPTLPAIVVQALAAMQDPKSDATSVEKVIARDPALSAKILRVANSAFFGYARRVSTIVDAIRILGFTNVQGMIIGVGAFDAFRTERLNLNEFWRHSIATATAARLLAPQVDCRSDEAFTAGILHDIGKLIFAIQADAGYQKVLDLERETGASSLEAERTLLEFTHPEVGETVAERWNLPARYVAAIAHHHDPDSASDESRFCALIGLADQAAHAISLAGELPPTREAERIARLEDLRLGSADWDDCLRRLQDAETEIDTFVSAIR
jgi:putative nucleotidyltransferase with HDIG domain